LDRGSSGGVGCQEVQHVFGGLLEVGFFGVVGKVGKGVFSGKKIYLEYIEFFHGVREI
jgi:hypothetical protein